MDMMENPRQIADTLKNLVDELEKTKALNELSNRYREVLTILMEGMQEYYRKGVTFSDSFNKYLAQTNVVLNKVKNELEGCRKNIVDELHENSRQHMVIHTLLENDLNQLSQLKSIFDGIRQEFEAANGKMDRYDEVMDGFRSVIKEQGKISSSLQDDMTRLNNQMGCIRHMNDEISGIRRMLSGSGGEQNLLDDIRQAVTRTELQLSSVRGALSSDLPRLTDTVSKFSESLDYYNKQVNMGIKSLAAEIAENQLKLKKSMDNLQSNMDKRAHSVEKRIGDLQSSMTTQFGLMEKFIEKRTRNTAHGWTIFFLFLLILLHVASVVIIGTMICYPSFRIF